LPFGCFDQIKSLKKVAEVKRFDDASRERLIVLSPDEMLDDTV
jgi:hypothetical protein